MLVSAMQLQLKPRQPNLRLKTQPKPHKGVLPLASELLSLFYFAVVSDTRQGTLTDGKGSMQLTSLNYLVKVSCFLYFKHYLLFYKTS
jgi:hypothetical protein